MNIFDNISILFISLYSENVTVLWCLPAYVCLCPKLFGKEWTVSAKTPSLVALAVKIVIVIV